MGSLLREVGARLLRSVIDYQDSRQRSRAYSGTLSVDEVRSGEVVKVDRGAYDHYGIFVRVFGGNGCEELHVIHYTGRNGHNDFNGIVRETALDDFLNGSDEFTVCHYSGGECVERLRVWDVHGTNAQTSAFSGANPPADSPDPDSVRTIERARNSIGKEGYSLSLNNCEHFAVWCRTGESESSQVDDVLHALIMPRK